MRTKETWPSIGLVQVTLTEAATDAIKYCFTGQLEIHRVPLRGGARGRCQPEFFGETISMQAIGHQLGELFLGAVPTVLIILLFYFIFRALFFKPLLQVMAERESRTAGAQAAAAEAQAAAAERVKQYQKALKQARGQVYAEQEAARKKLLDERAGQLKEARAKASGQVTAAKERVAGELASARRDLEATVVQLSAQIARRLLQTPPRPGTPAREAR